jgi:hypothetical protein
MSKYPRILLTNHLKSDHPNLMSMTPHEALAEAAAVLRGSDRPGAQHVADALAAWLENGGDIRRRLGILGKRGRRYDVPHERARREELAKLLCTAAAALPEKTTQAKARRLSRAIVGEGDDARLPSAAARAIVFGLALGLPRSADRIATILRQAERDRTAASYAIVDRWSEPR